MDPSVQPLRELAYLPKGAIDPHDVSDQERRAGGLPHEVMAVQPEIRGKEGS